MEFFIAFIISQVTVHVMNILDKFLQMVFFILDFEQNVKAYLRRGTAREMLGYYKEAIDGLSLSLNMHTAHI